MENFGNLCLGCMRPSKGEPECPYCGFAADSPQLDPYLPLKTQLNDRYVIGRVLDSNGEGFTYLAFDTVTGRPARIREYFPDALCERTQNRLGVRVLPGNEFSFNDNLLRFSETARTLARLSDLPALLFVYEIFEQSGTVYYASEHADSILLREFLIRNGGTLRWEQARPLLMPVLSTIAAVNRAGLIHRGISPETLIVGRDGKVRLINFCVPAARTARTDLQAQLFPGFAAVEQYGFESSQQGSWTDVYGFAATLFRVLVGNIPPEATERVTDDRLSIPAKIADTLPEYVIDALADALQILPKERTESADLFRQDLTPGAGGKPVSRKKAVPAPAPTVRDDTAKRPKAADSRSAVPDRDEDDEDDGHSGGGHYWFTALIISVLILLGVGTALWFLLFNKTDDNTSLDIISYEVSSVAQSIVAPSYATGKPVPDLKGKKYSDVNGDLSILGSFTLNPPEIQQSDTAKGTILSQTPAAGERVQDNLVITVVISSGPATAAVPSSVLGKTEIEAKQELWKVGFFYDNIKTESICDLTKPDSVVVKVEPVNGNTKISIYSKITIYVNKLPETSSENADSEDFDTD
ncbi:MAG: PASTA domain-containing protein [Oscillospiraceae bacterium]|jgi:serine/threonine-protein kinase|nr:PASTA domain-containing protein [Oscillospiraceae bacterium]